MLSKIYIRYNLRFADRQLELQYEKSKRNYHRLLLHIVILYGLVLGVIGWFINPFEEPDYLHWKRVLAIIIILISTLVIFLLGLKKPNLSPQLLKVIVLVFFFGFMEIFFMSKWNNNLYFTMGMTKEFLALSLVLARNSWMTSVLLLLFMNLLCSFRYMNFDNNYEMRFLPLMEILFSTILQSISAYFLEKYDRESFFKIKKYEHSHFCFKDLITNAFPNAVLIIKEEKVVFHNHKAMTILECNDVDQLLDKIETLQLEEAFKNSDKLMQKDYVMTEDCRPILNENFNETSIRMPRILNYQLEKPKTYIGILESSNGTKKSLEINLTRIMWDHEYVLMIILSENEIIAKMRIINQRSEYKDRLLATVSHDLRTPLNGIMGMIRMAIETNAEDAQTRNNHLSIALRSSQLLLLMINDILDYSQIANGKLRLNFETFNLWNVIKDVSKLFKFQTKMKGISFFKENLAGDRAENTTIRSDQNRLKQVLFNLLGNALKFTVKGSIKISLKPWSDKSSSKSEGVLVIEPRIAFVITVEDTGIGIKKEEQGTLFKLFGKIQNESTSNLNKNGVGLGLAISQSLVKFLNRNRKGGEITLESEFGKGSCFSLVLFSDKEEEIREELYQRSLEEKSEHEMSAKFHILEREIDLGMRTNSFRRRNKTIKRNKQILVVDDDQINILVVTSYLKAFSDYEFDVAFDGEEAIQRVKERALESIYYDIILMDCNMPKMNGPEATCVIDKMIQNEEIPTLAIIVCTANASHKDYDFYFENGMIDYITKPFTKEEIRRKIEKY